MASIDFGFNEGVVTNDDSTTQQNPVEDINTGEEVVTNSDGDEVENIDNASEESNEQKPEDKQNEPSHTGDSKIEPGTVYEIGEDKYTIDENGNMLDKDNKVFKKVDEVADFLKEFTEETNEPEEFDVNEIIKAVGIEVKDDKDQNIEFDNTAEGVASYVKSVINSQRNEYAQAGVNRLLEQYPFVADIINYYNANGGTLEGFGEVRDRTSIQVDENNEAQQIGIIREAWREFNKYGDVEKYINYLKETGGLVDAAKNDLQALQNKDTANKTKLEEEARLAQEEEQRRSIAYWTGVKNTIDSRKLGRYTIPETIMITRDGKNVASTPQDFFNYVYQINENGESRYVIDLQKQSVEDALNDELLRAYLMFTGKSYDSLVDLAKAEKEVIRLRAAKNNNTRRTMKVTKPAAKANNKDINFGYND